MTKTIELVGLEFNGPVNTTKVNSSLTTLFQARLSPLSGSPVLVHILSPETDNCPFWIWEREGMTVQNISWQSSRKNVAVPDGDWTCDILILDTRSINISAGTVEKRHSLTKTNLSLFFMAFGWII